jgi:GNAT superfamily N-acetyltransferase
MIDLVSYRDELAEGVVDVIHRVHDEYGFTWEPDGYHRDLYRINDEYFKTGGAFWALVEGAKVVGCVGVTLHDRHRGAHDPQGSMPIESNPALKFCELHRLYLLSDYRGLRLGRRMLDATMEFGRDRGCTRMIAWSDVKLPHAHEMYKQAGFVQEKGTRLCNDPDKSLEYGFWKEPL